MRAGDAAAEEVVRTYIKYLAAGIANVINAFEPEVLSIGGGISNEGDYLLDLLIPALQGNIYAQGRIPGTTIRIAQLRGDAGIVGAAALGA
jgi:glucokinase